MRLDKNRRLSKHYAFRITPEMQVSMNDVKVKWHYYIRSQIKLALKMLSEQNGKWEFTPDDVVKD